MHLGALVAVAVLVVLCCAACSCLFLSRARRAHAPIYMDHNGTTPIHPAALARYVRVSRESYGNPSTACAVGRRSKDVLESARGDIADELGCKQTQVIFTSGATEANVLVLRGFVRNARRARRRCCIVTTRIEHASIANTVNTLAEDGVDVAFVGTDRYGVIDESDVRALIAGVPRSASVLFAFIWINNEVGTIQDVDALVRAARAARDDVHVHADATQVAGRYLMNVNALGVDSLSLSAHKFYGPHGAGVLYLRGDARVDAVMTGGKQEKGMRGGTENVAACAAMATALRVSNAALRRGAARKVAAMRDSILRGLVASVPGVVVNTHPQRCAFNTVSVCVPCDSRQLVEHLSSRHGICLAVGSACSKGGSSSTLQALGVDATALRGSLRISLGFFNTAAECEAVVERVAAFVAGCADSRGAAGGAAVPAP